MNVIAIDFGGTMIKMGLFLNDKLACFTKLEAKSKDGITSRLDDVKDEVYKMINQLNLSIEDFLGIGIAMPGIINFDEKKVLSINDKYNDAVDIDFSKWAEDKFKLPIIMDNDANVALMGEHALGTTGNSKHAALVIFGTGVGTAAFINGQLLRGAHYQAGCLGGHSIIDYDGYPCNCGNIGCLEAQASTWAIPKILADEPDLTDSSLANDKDYRIKNIVDHARNGDKLANKVLQDLIKKWSAGIINIIHAYDPEVIVLSGGVMNAADLIAEPLFKRVRELAWTPYGIIDLKISKDPEQSVLHGLNYLVKENIKNV